MSKGAVTRERILDQALATASVDGLGALSLGDLAHDVGMSKSGLFAHFRSKEALQLDVLNAAAERFREVVIVPTLAAPRGVPRLRTLFRHWLEWENYDRTPGGCVFVHAAFEWDDHPGPVREALVAMQREHMTFVAGAAQRAGIADPEQFAFQLLGIMLAYHYTNRLLRDPAAKRRAKAAFESLVASC
jgi:AcrR family transcriptional regulator